MKTISYVIQDPIGLHARPAGQLAKAAGTWKECEIKITVGAKTVDAKRIMGVMQLGAKQGNTLTLEISGPQEAEAAAALEEFLKSNL